MGLLFPRIAYRGYPKEYMKRVEESIRLDHIKEDLEDKRRKTKQEKEILRKVERKQSVLMKEMRQIEEDWRSKRAIKSAKKEFG